MDRTVIRGEVGGMKKRRRFSDERGLGNPPPSAGAVKLPQRSSLACLESFDTGESPWGGQDVEEAASEGDEGSETVKDWRRQEATFRRYCLVREPHWRVNADFARVKATLNDPITKRCLEKSRDRDNKHPWDRSVRVPRVSMHGASSFIPSSDMIPIEDEADETRALLVDAFLQNNRLEHLLQVMAYHPQYLECFLKTQHFLMRGDGPLPYPHRHYIAIMAAARHRCSYLIHIHTQEFLLQGGDEMWLRGIKYVPDKISSLNKINKILAHTPWLITKDHIKELCTGENKWTLSEVMQSLVLLAHFHAVCSFVFGCGVSSEIDQSSGHVTKPQCNSVSGGRGVCSRAASLNSADVLPPDGSKSASNNVANNESATNDDQNIKSNGNGSCCVKHCNSADKIKACDGGEAAGGSETSIEVLMKKMKELTREQLLANEEEMRENFERVEANICEYCASNQPPTSPPHDMSEDIRASIARESARYVDDPLYCYQDLSRGACSRRPSGGGGGGKGVATFCTSDFSWEHEGYSLSCRLYMEVGELLEEKFRVAENLTYYTMGDNVDVDTSSFRLAIWHYVHCLYAIRHVEYDYSVVNQLLEPKLKSFIRTVVCFPDRVTRQEYDSFMSDFKHSEKVHVNLMLLESRMQSELLYGLRAVSKYMLARDPAPIPMSVNHNSLSPPISPS